MGIRLLRTGSDMFAVYRDGVPAGSVRRAVVGGRRMWLADGVDGRRGVFPGKRVAAEWLGRSC